MLMPLMDMPIGRLMMGITPLMPPNWLYCRERRRLDEWKLLEWRCRREESRRRRVLLVYDTAVVGNRYCSRRSGRGYGGIGESMDEVTDGGTDNANGVVVPTRSSDDTAVTAAAASVTLMSVIVTGAFTSGGVVGNAAVFGAAVVGVNTPNRPSDRAFVTSAFSISVPFALSAAYATPTAASVLRRLSGGDGDGAISASSDAAGAAAV